ncbi:Lsr2 family protein [Rathayibacter sp. VKM Ac-2857]|uniref:histone-like nucleoid-structuring protein Lsr2 n=1 Tax=Rathayibacter sp. VKM Ac-2857 TaxID=2739020 RepID=UPI0015643CE5|nr:Lsr2 family protein [Rathayibacter sp. VKM Ac-2857]NQX18192.1 Lsr2 family protein [Rathayibacter sp. VKM Ac-2857]
MAQRTTLIDDLDGTPITPGRGGTITFSLDDNVYEIDLRLANAAHLHRAIAPYINAARPTDAEHAGRPRHRVTAVRASAGRKSPETLAAIRHWATRHGHDVPRSGRIPADVQAAYDIAH